MSDETTSAKGTNVRRVRRAGALLLAVLFFVAAPMMSVASAAAEPLTPGQVMSHIFGTWSRKVDPTEKGVAVTPPPAPPPQLQASSEPAPPKAPAATAGQPRLWFDRQTVRRKPPRRAR